MTKESQIEDELIKALVDLKYIYRQDIRDRDALEQNFREKFEELNKVKLTDNEFSRLLEKIISADVFAAAKLLRENNSFERDDGTPLHFTLVNIKDWCKNSFEVVNQLRMNTHSSHHRYDVILLINGVPIVQIELKSLDISPRRAIEQIVTYKNDAGNGYNATLLCFMQLFVVSNQSKSWYFANNNNKHFSFNADERFLPVYEFADKQNNKITDLTSFTQNFLAKCKLGETISRYMVLVAGEKKLMMMRPYQVYAVQEIVASIAENRGNGYIWHTTGSGKTLTSFKASTLLKDNPDIEKCLFVVDRKDLDRQTRDEFNRFQEGCVEENTNTAALVARMLSTDYADKVIVATIQKLGLALDGKNKKDYKKQLEPLSDKRIVFIFDECHRSQFGDNHQAIKEFFPNAQLFGFTGTPIFEDNAIYTQVEGEEASMKTTKDIFQNKLHAYTITHAIEDKNVLKFHVDYYGGGQNQAAQSDNHRQAVVENIIEKHNTATHNRKFNAVFATGSINEAIDYYQLFQQIQDRNRAARNDHVDDSQPLNIAPDLNIACVFSPPAEGNKDVTQLQEDLPQEKADNTQQPAQKKAALKQIMADYNKQYGTNHDINNFDLYYQDVQSRIKHQQYSNQDVKHAEKIDITIVVDMLLTGFDSKYLNTLYVDKNLRHHGLIQAFSRTNRVLNDSKPYGNILDFRGQEEAVDAAIALFSGEGDNAGREREIWLVEPAPVVINKFAVAAQKLESFMTAQKLACEPSQVANIKGDKARAEFITCFKEVQRLKTQLDQYTDLDETQEERIEQLVASDDMRGFRSHYIETARQLKELQGGDEGAGQTEPVPVDELDFELVLFGSALIDYDYIMELLAKSAGQPAEKQKMTRDQLINDILADAQFMDEGDDITAYIDSLKAGASLTKEGFGKGYEAFKLQKIRTEQDALAEKHGLEAAELQAFVDHVVGRKIFNAEKLTDLFAAQDLGWKQRGAKEVALMKELIPLMQKQVGKHDKISGLGVFRI